MDRFYEKVYGHDYYDDYGGGLSYFENRILKSNFKLLSRHIRHTIGGKTHLDAGCAAGYLVEAMREVEYESTGFDLEYIIKESSVPGLIQSNIVYDTLPRDIVNTGFDVVTCVEVFEHLRPMDLDVATMKLVSYVKRGGYLIFSSSPYDEETESHLSVFPTQTWIESFERFGMKLTSRLYYRPIPWAFLMRKNG